MKIYLTKFCLLFVSVVFAQDINMQTGTFNQCSGVLFDSGGVSSDYANDENFTITICPDVAGELMSLDFTDFNTEDGVDILTIFNGDDTSAFQLGQFSGTNSPGFVQATLANATGCLTLTFTSNDSNVAGGWAANIACLTSCQTITAQLDSTSPLPDANGYLRVCPNEPITLNSSAIFSEDGTGATYEWDLDDGNTATGQTATFSYDTPGSYIVRLTIRDTNTDIDPLGCTNSNLITQVIQVSNEPDFTGTEATDQELCLGESTTITGQVIGVLQPDNCAPPISGITFLPDGTGDSYETTVAVECFDPSQTITDVREIVGVCVNIEHSFSGDLNIDLIAPNGQEVRLYDQNDGSANFGIPWATGGIDGDSNNTTPGTGFTYCFRPDTTLPTTSEAVIANVTFPSGDGPGTYDDSQIPAGDYEPVELFDDFIGTTLNGNWTIRVTDNFGADNGYIFDWSIEFDPSIVPAELSFTPTIVSESWDADLTITATNGNEITVQPNATGQFCYTYRAVNDFGCEYTEEVCIDVFDVPTANTIDPQLRCDDNNDGFWDFDLDALRVIALGTQDPMQYEVSFHLEESDALTSSTTNPLPDTFTNLVAYEEDTIWVRVENVDKRDCFGITSFIVDVFEQPLPSTYTYELCDDNLDGDDTNGFVEFPLTPADIDSFILNGQDPLQFTVSYHLNQTDADNDTGAITNLYTNDTQIIARVENNDNINCFETIEVNLQVNALPLITNMVELLQCDNDTDGISDFNLNEANSLISTNSANETFSFYLTLADAQAGTNAIPDPTAYTNTDPSSNPDIIFVRVENADTCFRVAQLDLFVSATQIPANIEILYEICDVGNVDDDIANGVESFDFSDAEAQIRTLAGLPTGQDLTFTFYESEADALAELNAIPDISNHRNVNSPFEQEIYVRVDSDVDNSCVGLGLHVRLRTINPQPNIPGVNEDLILCDDITVGDLTEEFDLTQNETFIFNSIPNLTASYFLSYDDALNNVAANEITTPANYNNTNPTETIFVRVEDVMTGCIAIVDFDITVNPLPNDDIVVADIFECENNTNFIFPFDIESKTDEILNIQDDPTNYTVTYHDSQQDADNLVDALSSPYENTVSPAQTIYVAVTNNTTGCSISTITFNIEIQEGANAEDILYEECDFVGDNDGFTQFDLESIEPLVLNGQDPTAFSIDFFDNFDDAFNNNLPNRLPLLYENATINSQVIYARVSNNIRPDECFEVSELTLQVNLLPIFDLEDEYILCFSSSPEAVVDVPPVLDTGLSEADYDFKWSFDGTILTTETGASLIPTQGGLYTVEVTDTSTSAVTMCMDSDTALVIESGLPDVFDVEVTSMAFNGNNMILATASGNSTYEFSLNNGPYQLSGEFENVTGGDNIVYVRDILGCGIDSRMITVIDYPKFFTPNGDGNNDTWQIKGIDSQPDAIIYIHDRYGKLLKQIGPTGQGWDGTYNGNRMPSSDYWFVLEFREPTTDERKTFRAHFSLKR